MDRQDKRPDGNEEARDPEGEFERLAHGLSRAARRGQALGRRGPSKPARPATPQIESKPVPPRALPQATPPEKPRARQTESTGPAHGATPSAAAQGRSASNSTGPAPARSARDVAEQAAAARDLTELRARVAACEACSLCETRTQTVFMDGRAERGVMFIGEAPGAEEDKSGVPFVGRSGQLLTDIITKGMGIPRQEVAIANVLKCRPPENRPPTPAEKTTCTPWLDRQIELIDPKVLIPLGRHAAMHVLKVDAPMGAMRQQVHEIGGRKVVPTFHPSYLLRSPGEKKECWKDIQLAMGVLGIDPKANS
ncbi:MAG: uracil-DNA glycosylase [Planctomycetes bacterium]|nr:uracil-DNA glycosylase [Planctomycetota bacterium]